MTIALKENKLPFIGIAGELITVDVQFVSDEKAGTAVKPSRPTSQQMISCDINLNIAAGGCRRNPRLPAVSLPLAGGVTPSLPDFGSKDTSGATFVAPETVKGKDGKEVIGENSPIGNYLPTMVIGKDGKERAATKQKAQSLITSTTVVIAINTAAGGNNRLKPSLYCPLAFKTGISELATRYNRFLDGLTSFGGQSLRF